MKIKLTQIGNHKIEVIKLIILFTGLGLKESKELTDIVPSIFEVNKPDIKFEQMQKNFAAIGAKIENVEPIKKAVKNVPGEDVSEKKPSSKKKSKTHKSINPQNKKWEKPKFTNQKTIKTYTDNNFLSLDKKADDLSFTKSVKNALAITVFGAFAFAVSIFYFPISTFLAFLIIGVAIAITLRTINYKTSRNLGILAAVFTLFSYFISSLFYYLIFLYFIGTEHFYNELSFLPSLFSFFYPSSFIPIIAAYLIASNFYLGEKLSSVFIVKDKTNKSNFNNKTYKKDTKRKKRKLD